MHLPQICLSTFNNDRIQRQQGAFITPPILGGEDRDNPDEVRLNYKNNLRNKEIVLKNKKDKLESELSTFYKYKEKLSNDQLIRSDKREFNYQKEKKLESVKKLVQWLDNYEIPDSLREKVTNYKKECLQLMFDIRYSGYRQALTYAIKKLEAESIVIDEKSKSKIKKTLSSLGINEGTVYPDLKHISDYYSPNYLLN